MPESIAIIYFSGTGNTEVVTGFLAKKLREYFYVDVFRAEDITRGNVEFEPGKYRMIGLGYPVYGFNVPKIMYNLIQKMPGAAGQKAFVYSTCAGPLYFNNIASYGLKKELKAKGFNVFYERQFYMPANIATRYNDEVAKQLCNKASEKAVTMVEEIRNNVKNVRTDRIGPKLMSWLYLIEKKAWKRVSGDFIVLESCTKCRKCIRDCPMENITFSDEKIVFGKNCTACYRCVYMCPVRAITGRKYKFAIFKDGYDIKKILTDDKLKGDYITLKTRGYYGVFKKYLFKKR
ncbi:MAG: EFR1 family ferrodoxin [Lentihominibacter sp.]|jgi:ferredoxin